MCTRCKKRSRLPGPRSTWCRECKTEWQRKHRRANGVRPRVRSIHERLHERLVRDEESGCLIWTGPLNHGGYGVIGREGGRGAGMALAHVVSWVEVNGPVPDGLELDHLCYVTACCEPSHLEAVTHEVNVGRARARCLLARDGRCPRGHTYDSTVFDRKRGKRYQRCLTCARISAARRALVVV